MPPEVAAFLRGGEWEEGAHFPASPAADLYAFGALLYESLTDCHPFNPRLPLDKLLLAIEFVPPVEPVQLEPRVPPGLNSLVMRLLAKDPAQRPPSARAVHEELMRLLEGEGNTEAWTVPYAFTTEEGAGAPPGELQPEAETGAREEPAPSPVPGSDAPAASGMPGTGGAERDDGRPASRWRRGLAVFAFVLLLIGIAWGFDRTVFASALEAVCSGAAPTALVPPAPSEKGCEALLSTPPKSFRDTRALLCAASVQLLACAGAPVRPDAGGFLEQCPPEARQTAARAGFEQMPFTDVELVTGVHVGTVSSPGMLNVKSGPMEGWMFLPGDERSYRVTGEAKVFQKRFYVQFDRIYLDALYPTPGIVPSPICAVVVSEREPTKKFGVLTYEIDKPIGAELDPAKVVYRGADAAILNAQLVDVYVQLPGRRFPE
jgi:serine/threonine-protein kinase